MQHAQGKRKRREEDGKQSSQNQKTERLRDGDPVRLFASQSLQGWSGGDRASALRAALVATGVQPGSLILEFRAEEVRHNMRTLLELAPELRQMEVRLSLAGIGSAFWGLVAGVVTLLALRRR